MTKRGRPRKNPELLKRNELIVSTSASISSVLASSIKRHEAEGVPEFVAYEVIDLAEIMCDDNIRRQVVNRLLDRSNFDLETSGLIRKYFDLY